MLKSRVCPEGIPVETRSSANSCLFSGVGDPWDGTGLLGIAGGGSLSDKKRDQERKGEMGHGSLWVSKMERAS